MHIRADADPGEEARRVPRALWIAMLVAFFLMAVRIASLDSPVLGADEYVYVHAAKYQASGEQIYTLDPHLARVENKVYPWLYRGWAAVSAEHADSIGRLFHSALYCLAALLLFAIFRRCLDRRSATLGALLYLLMPFSFYATTLMPEVEFQLSIYALVWVWTMRRGPPSWGQLALAAAVSAASYLIKPHGVAAILASAAYLLWNRAGAAPGAMLRRLLLGMLQAAVYLACTAVLIKLLRLALDPGGSSPVVSSFYQIYLDKLRDPAYLRQSLTSMAGYIGGHLWVWLVFFAPGVLGILADLRAWLPWHNAQADGAEQEPRRRLALVLFLLMASLLCMVALFTAAASGVRDFERWRLHGRYLAALLPFLLAYGVWWVGRKPPRWVAAVGVVALLSFVYWGRFWFRLFPWDYPDLFGLFDPQLTHWSFDHMLRWPLRATVAAGVLCWAAFAFSRRQRLAYLVFVAVALLAAQGQVSAWLDMQNRLTHQARVDGAAMRAFMAGAAPGSGLVASYDRTGETSFMLAALDMQVHVLQLEQGSALGARDVPAGVSWVVAPAGLEVPLPDAWKLDFGNQRLYLLENSNMRPIAPEKTLWDGRQPLLVDTTAAAGLSRFQGFRVGENWGRWSIASRARVVLPKQVSGRVRVEFFGWVFNAEKNPAVTVKLGDAAAQVPMTGQGQQHELVLDIRTPADSLWFESTPVSDGGSMLGVAVGPIRITALPAQE